MLSCAVLCWVPLCRVFKTTYGGNWRIPDTKNRGTWPKTRQGWELVWALQRKLSLTAWGGNMSLDDRDEQCKQYC